MHFVENLRDALRESGPRYELLLAGVAAHAHYGLLLDVLGAQLHPQARALQLPLRVLVARGVVIPEVAACLDACRAGALFFQLDATNGALMLAGTAWLK